MNKIYKPVKDFDDYEISEDGEVFNIKTNTEVKINYKNEIHYVKLSKDNYKKTFTLSRLIYETFNDIKLKHNEYIKFKDENKLNLYYTNLVKTTKSNITISNKEHELDKTKKWKEIKGNGDYMISNNGDIYSKIFKKMLKLKIDENGYSCIKFNKKMFKVHRLVYDTFKGIKNEDTVIDHIDRNKQNNNLNNLREISKSENSKNRDFTKNTTNKVYQYTLDGNLIKKWNSILDVCKELKCDKDTISKCYYGKKESALGFKWKIEGLIEDTSEFRNIKISPTETLLDYKINNKGQIINKKNILLRYRTLTGYYSTNIKTNDNNNKCVLLHRLVAMTFLENPNNYEIVNHKDKNRLNNNVENLEWCTLKHNSTHAIGKKVNKLDIKTGKIIKTYNSINEAYCDLDKKSTSTITAVCKGKRNSAYGFKWEYAK